MDTTSIKRVLRSVEVRESGTQSIGKLVSDVHFVSSDAPVQAVADDIRDDTGLLAVGVVDEDMRVVGIIVRDEFLTLMARPFARDVLRNRSVNEVMTETTSFAVDRNLFSIAEEIDDQMRAPGITYYLLHDEHRRFAGVFSTQDMLIYLSRMTQNDIGLARQLQSRIVKGENLVSGQTFEFASSSATAKGVGGDYYMIKRYSDTNWIIAMCDVSGKGVAASIVTSMLYGVMSVFDFRRGLADFVKQLNEHIVHTFETEKFVTAVFMDYNEQTGIAKFCDMGHSHMFLLREGKLMRVQSSKDNLPIGIVPKIEPVINKLKPQDGDLLFLLTDGLLEQQNGSGEEYSLEQVGDIIRKGEEEPVELIVQRV